MAVAVVDRLEVIDVDQQQGCRLLLRMVPVEQGSDLFLPVLATAQAGQRVLPVEFVELEVLPLDPADQPIAAQAYRQGVDDHDRQGGQHHRHAAGRSHGEAGQGGGQAKADRHADQGTPPQVADAEIQLVGGGDGEQGDRRQQVELHQRDEGADHRRVDHEVAQFGRERVATALRMQVGQLRPGQPAEQHPGPRHPAGIDLVQHHQHRKHAQGHAQRAQPMRASMQRIQSRVASRARDRRTPLFHTPKCGAPRPATPVRRAC